jgi:adenosylmethionine-8-amino-7-oxononanoate aminotransferase
LAKKLADITPDGLNRVFYSDNGATSVEIALKMAYQYWRHKQAPERKIFVHLNNAYHGDTVGAMSVGGIDVFRETFDKLLFETVAVPEPYVYRSPISDDPTTVRDHCLSEMENVLRRYSGQIAGIILEPLIQGAGGMIVAPEGFLKGVETLARKYNTLLILDEVMTGIGRTGRMWACEHENVAPDILCTAKGLTAGYLPLAATVASDDIYNAFLGEYRELKTFFHGHTFTGNQLGCAVALANLKIFEKEHLIEKIQPTIAHFKRRLQEFNTLEHVGDVRVCGLAAGVELVRDKATKEAYPFDEQMGGQVCNEALRRNVILRPLVNTIVLMPPLQISIPELDQLLEVVYASIEEITGVRNN